MSGSIMHHIHFLVSFAVYQTCFGVQYLLTLSQAQGVEVQIELFDLRQVNEVIIALQ